MAKQPFIVHDFGLEPLVEPPNAKLFEPVSLTDSVLLLGTDRQIAQMNVDANGNHVMTLSKTSPDILEVRKRLQRPLVVWGDEPEQPVIWEVTRYTHLGEEYDGSLKVSVEESTTK